MTFGTLAFKISIKMNLTCEKLKKFISNFPILKSKVMLNLHRGFSHGVVSKVAVLNLERNHASLMDHIAWFSHRFHFFRVQIVRKIRLYLKIDSLISYLDRSASTNYFLMIRKDFGSCQ